MQLNAAVKLSDLAGTGAALEALKHDRARQYAIRINDRYRLCFVWTGSDAGDVEIVDYH
jgi:proteic killer suppression protein